MVKIKTAVVIVSTAKIRAKWQRLQQLASSHPPWAKDLDLTVGPVDRLRLSCIAACLCSSDSRLDRLQVRPNTRRCLWRALTLEL